MVLFQQNVLSKNRSMRIKVVTIVCFSLILSSTKVNAQSICLVSADYQTGENYMVFWEQFADLTNLDSVFIYRNQGMGTSFNKIGAVDIEQNSPTYFEDVNVSTIEPSQYAISILDSSNVETSLSLWHQPMVLDWDPSGSGKLFWTKYKKENQVNDSYIFSYEYFIDETGIGAYQSFGTVMNYDTMGFDTQFSAHPNANYYVVASLPTCNIQTKANINTSRSNIKQQFSNASAGISTISNTINFELSPNPSSDYIMIQLASEMKAKMTITDMNGRVLKTANITSDFYTVSIEDLANGQYFVNIVQNDVISSKKFIKK